MPSKWVRDAQRKHHNEHLERIRKMNPVVDNKKPRELPMSGKKEIERRQFRDKVEKGNRLLLDRLGKALERKNIDNERKAIKFNSLEQGKKKAELKRVTMENQLLLNRIQFAQPMYDHNQWERDAEHREFYLKNMTEFPEMYCPHYPPMRRQYLKELALKDTETRMTKLANLNSKRAQEGLDPLRLEDIPSNTDLHFEAERNEGRGPFGEYRPGNVPPPPKEPFGDMTRPHPASSLGGRGNSGSPGRLAITNGVESTRPTDQLQQAIDNIDKHTLMVRRSTLL